MADKSLVLAIYLAVGAALAYWPIWVGRVQTASPHRENAMSALWWALAAAVLIALTFRVAPLFALAAATGAASVVYRQDRAERAPLAAFSVLGFSAVAALFWWKPLTGASAVSSLASSAAFGALTAAFLFVLPSRAGATLTAGGARPSNALLLSMFALAAAVATFNTGIYSDDEAFATSWHHWGAYIGPAQLLAAGARPFYDIPLQYGLGPTLLTALACQSQCGVGFFGVAGGLTFLLAMVVGALTLGFTTQARWNGIARAMALAAAFLCSFVWTAYPANVLPALSTPSTGGLRFFPALALAALLIWRFGRGPAPLWPAHLLWILALFWSPEAAFQATCVWAPAYAYLRLEPDQNRIFSVAWSWVRLAVIGVTPVVVALLAYRIFYGVFPAPYGVLAYMINPPGPLPINPLGSIWGFIAVMAVAIAVARTNPLGKPAFDLMICVMLAFGGFSYFLGRSHDNNILNLAPSMVLVLAASAPLLRDVPMRATHGVLLAGFLAGVAFFGWERWGEVAGRADLFAFRPAELTSQFSYQNPATAARLRARFAKSGVNAGNPGDAARAVEEISHDFSEPATILDMSLSLDLARPPVVWTALHNPVNYTYIPSSRRREFLVRTAGRLAKPGWLVIDKSFADKSWLADFDAAYTRTAERDYGDYTAIRFVPPRRN